MIDRAIGNPACNIPIGFAGAFGVLREPNGLYYMNARYYDPSMGRFLSEDPLGLAGGDLTLYSYAGNNPVVFVDPSGLCASSGGSQNTLRNNLANGLYFLSDVTNDISKYTGIAGTGSLIISGGLSTPYSTIPLAASFVSWGLSTTTGVGADWLAGDTRNLRNRVITAAPQLLMNLTATGTIGEKIIQGITGEVYESYVKNPMRRTH